MDIEELMALGSGMFILWVIVGGVIYFIPAIVAYHRYRRNKGAILCLNIFLGWTFVGWVIALVWAISEEKDSGSHTYYVNPENQKNTAAMYNRLRSVANGENAVVDDFWYCTKCGEKNEKLDSFCKGCGNYR